MDISLTNLLEMSLPMLIAIGVVNVVSMKVAMTSAQKWGLSFLVAFVVGFVPAELGNVILEHIKNALGVAFAASGLYKLTQNK